MGNLVQLIKEYIPPLDYAQSRGLTFKRVGNKGEYFCNEMDSMSINVVNGLWHRRSAGVGGSVIDLAAYLEKVDVHQALSILRQELPGYYIGAHENGAIVRQKPVEKGSFIPPPKSAKGYRRIYAYLLQTRHISVDIVSEMVHRKMLYEDERHNCAFLGYDETGAPKYCSLRGTISGKSFKGDYANSDKSVGWYVHNGAQKLFVVEAPIEAMSIMTMLQLHGRDWRQYNYLALGTNNTAESLLRWIDFAKPPMNTVYLALNNDEAGYIGIHKLQQTLVQYPSFDGKIFKKLPVNNDFNDDLRALVYAREQGQAAVLEQ